MAEKLYHAGLRLKNFIEKSGLTITDVVNKTNIPRSSLYDMFSKNELLLSRVQPVLTAIEIDTDTWLGFKQHVDETQSPYGMQALIDSLTRENDMLRKQVENLKEQIVALKAKKKR